MENARALDRLLNEVPLDADEIREVGEETGIDAKRLAAKIKERIECVADDTSVKGDVVDNAVPKVTCSRCKRAADCKRVSDGTVYKPTAWLYPDKSKPYEGICGGCRGEG